MTCPYFSRLGKNKIFCQAYGETDVSDDKMVECHSNYACCFKEAERHLENETERGRVAAQESSDIGDCVENEFSNFF